MPANGLLSVHIAVALLAGTGLFSQLVSLPALDITFYRCMVAFALLSLVLAITKQSFRLQHAVDYLIAITLGILVSTHWVTYFYAMQWSSVAAGMIALYTYPVITVLIEPLLLRQLPKLRDVLCALVVLVGIIIMLPISEPLGDVGSGILLGVFSAILFAARNLLYKYKFSQYSATKTMFYQTLVGALLLLPLMPWLSDTTSWQWPSGHNLALLLLLGTLFTALPHALLVNALRSLSASSVALISCLQPFYGTLLAILVLWQWPSWQTILGGALILSGACYETYKSRKISPK
ncbi:DMT family transporter [Motilimonas eburnea]|uniref:DMT family transporter n=1 Tax=Motilimonas eburnea TaxID=1737488 RepID=UPI001E5F085B|nr:DMT family transporter [Motilimonas eburnea]